VTGTTGYEQELREADRIFAREVAAAAPGERGAVWARWFTSTGRQVVPGQVIEGSASISDVMSRVFANPGYSLTWAPDVASASKDGSMGWTSGRYENRRAGTGGEIVEHGRYLSIWRRGEDGSWRVELDTGVPDPGD